MDSINKTNNFRSIAMAQVKTALQPVIEDLKQVEATAQNGQLVADAADMVVKLETLEKATHALQGVSGEEVLSSLQVLARALETVRSKAETRVSDDDLSAALTGHARLEELAGKIGNAPFPSNRLELFGRERRFLDRITETLDALPASVLAPGRRAEAVRIIQTARVAHAAEEAAWKVEVEKAATGRAPLASVCQVSERELTALGLHAETTTLPELAAAATAALRREGGADATLHVLERLQWPSPLEAAPQALRAVVQALDLIPEMSLTARRLDTLGDQAALLKATE